MPGYKDFTRGETFEASDVNDYLMLQSVMVFDTEVDRSASLANVLRPGLAVYIKSSNILQIYTGASWVSVARYDSIPGVVAEDEVLKRAAMEAVDVKTVNIQREFLFYSIFSNYVDGTWPNRIWR